jgi:IMP dehydrogenase
MEIKGFLNDATPCLNFDDVLIEPRLTDIHPEEADISTTMIKGICSQLPVISAHMETVSSTELITAISEMGGLGTLHREMAMDQIESNLSHIKSNVIDRVKYPHAATTPAGTPWVIVACSPYDLERAEYLLQRDDVHFVILDNVQPLHVQIIKNVRLLSQKYPDRIIVGNIVNREGANVFARFPLAALKVGLGSGSICTTRIVTGCGMSQLTAIIEVAEVAKQHRMCVIADGGIRNSGDIIKALAAGADGVMLGKLMAGCEEAPGKTVEIDGKKYKQYEGAKYNSVEMPEVTGFDKIDAFLRAERQNRYRVEGASGLVPLTGPTHLLLYILMRSIKLSFGFVGARNIEELQKKAVMRFISYNSHVESQANLPIRTAESYL